jgi:hypothetical protein
MSQISGRWIEDGSIKPRKLDSTGSYKMGSLDTTNLNVVDALSVHGDATFFSGMTVDALTLQTLDVGVALYVGHDMTVVDPKTYMWDASVKGALQVDQCSSFRDAGFSSSIIVGNRVGIGTNAVSALHVYDGLVNLDADIASYSSGQLTIRGVSESNKQMRIGHNTTDDVGYLQAQNGGSFRCLSLNPLGGNVGIGITNPAVHLDVNGTVKGIDSTSTGNAYVAGRVGIGSSSPTVSLDVVGSVNATNDFSGRDFLGRDSSSTRNMYVANRVGIGITNPQYTLDVNGVIRSLGTVSSGDLHVDGTLFDTDTSSTNNVYVANRVGIGTTAPVVSLHVNGDCLFGNLVKMGTITGATGYSTLRIWNDQNTALRGLEIDYAGSSYSGSLVAGGPTGEAGSISTTGPYPLILGTNNNFKVCILSNGNVGIGSSGPTVALDIVGSANVTGTISGLDSSSTGNAYVANRVGIGTTTPTVALDVNGNVIFTTGGYDQFEMTANDLTIRKPGSSPTWILLRGYFNDMWFEADSTFTNTVDFVLSNPGSTFVVDGHILCDSYYTDLMKVGQAHDYAIRVAEEYVHFNLDTTFGGHVLAPYLYGDTTVYSGGFAANSIFAWSYLYTNQINPYSGTSLQIDANTTMYGSLDVGSYSLTAHNITGDTTFTISGSRVLAPKVNASYSLQSQYIDLPDNAPLSDMYIFRRNYPGSTLTVDGTFSANMVNAPHMKGDTTFSTSGSRILAPKVNASYSLQSQYIDLPDNAPLSDMYIFRRNYPGSTLTVDGTFSANIVNAPYMKGDTTFTTSGSRILASRINASYSLQSQYIDLPDGASLSDMYIFNHNYPGSTLHVNGGLSVASNIYTSNGDIYTSDGDIYTAAGDIYTSDGNISCNHSIHTAGDFYTTAGLIYTGNGTYNGVGSTDIYSAPFSAYIPDGISGFVSGSYHTFFKRIGRLVYVWYDITGVSSADPAGRVFEFGLPYQLSSYYISGSSYLGIYASVAVAINSGVYITGGAMARMEGDSHTVALYPTGNESVPWNASDLKGAKGELFYEAHTNGTFFGSIP